MGTSQIIEFAANFKMVATAQLVRLFLHKRKAVEEETHFFQRLSDKEAWRRFTEELDFETGVAQAAAVSAILLTKKPRQERSQ